MRRTVRAQGRSIDYELVQTFRKSLELRLIEGQGVRLFAPKGCSLRACDAFVVSRADWLLDAERRFEAHRAAANDLRPMTQGALILLRGITCPLRIEPAESERVALSKDAVLVATPDPSPAHVRACLREALVLEARRTIEERLAHYAPQIGRTPRTVGIREQKTRWGSCSSLGGVNFNWKLIMAPPEALDYVVIHELCHLYELNHSRRFWALVEQHMPDYAVWKRWLKDNGSLLFV